MGSSWGRCGQACCGGRKNVATPRTSTWRVGQHTIEKSPSANSKLVIVYLDSTILGWAIGASSSRFHNIPILSEQEVG
jgi:hypothetical protein